MRGISRQIVGFIIGTIFLVIVIFLGAYAFSLFTSFSVEVQNRHTLNTLSSGLTQAWVNGYWDSGEGFSLGDTTKKHYYIVFINSSIAQSIKKLRPCKGVDYGCVNTNLDFSLCEATRSACLCLISSTEYLYFDFTSNYAISDSWETWNKTLIKQLNFVINDGGKINFVSCIEMGKDGYYVQSEKKAPDLLYEGQHVFGFAPGTYKIDIKNNCFGKNKCDPTYLILEEKS